MMDRILTIQSDIGIAIFIFSASQSYPLLVNYFPQFLFKHYAYLKDKYPDLVPVLEVSNIKNKDGT